MIEFRLAQQSDIGQQKEIWKMCFGDDDAYIDFYFKNLYKEDETMLLIYNGKIAAILRMMPIKMVFSDNREIPSSMFYAIATHGDYQGRGLSTKIIEYSNQYISNNNADISILVPASESLFGFYSKRGYKEGFYIREDNLQTNQIRSFEKFSQNKCILTPASPEEYNTRRNNLLKDQIYVAYNNIQISYQKEISKYSGADIYNIDIGEVEGCVAIEKISDEEIIMKELLIDADFVKDVLLEIEHIFQAEEYILRLPTYNTNHFGGELRAFGMYQVSRKVDIDMMKQKHAYLGFAYD